MLLLFLFTMITRAVVLIPAVVETLSLIAVFLDNSFKQVGNSSWVTFKHNNPMTSEGVMS